MITAWILFYSHKDDRYLFEERDGYDFDNTDPTAWGLTPSDTVILVLQRGSFINAWVEGKAVKHG